MKKQPPIKEKTEVRSKYRPKLLMFSQWCEMVYDPMLRPSTDIRNKKEPVEWGGRIWTDRE